MRLVETAIETKPAAQTKPLADGDVVRTALQVPVIKTKEEFLDFEGRFKMGGEILSGGYLPAQRKVLVVMMGIHVGMQASPFDFDDDGNVIEKAAQAPAEPASSI